MIYGILAHESALDSVSSYRLGCRSCRSMIRMPEKNFPGALLPLTPQQITLRTELVSDVP
jgi:hypothetical protein